MEHRTDEIVDLRREVHDLHEDVRVDMASDRRSVVAMRGQMADMKSEVMIQMKEIKQIMTMLFEIQTT